MPVNRSVSENIRESHTAERLQVDLKESGEDINKMRLKVRFEVQIEQVNGETVTKLGNPYDDPNWLILDPSQDEDIYLACQILQQKIGELRHAQLHAPQPEPEPDPLVEG